MKSQDFDVIVLGGGCIGSSILYALALCGFENIALIDKGRKNLSATSQSGGMFRVFHENAHHVDLALGHHQLLSKFQNQKVLQKIESPNGSLYFFEKHRYSTYQENLQKMEAAQYPFEILTSLHGKERFPYFKWKPEEMAIFEPLASQSSAVDFVEDLLQASNNHGAHVIDDFEIRRICTYRDHFRLYGEDAVLTAKWVILAGGARMRPRLQDLGLNLDLKTKTLTVYRVLKEAGTVMPNYFDRESLQFGSFAEGTHGLLSNLEQERVLTKIWKPHFETQQALDLYAPGRVGYLGLVSGHPRLMLATGWGGTGFKFSLEIGRLVAEKLQQQIPERRSIYAQF